MNTDKQTEKTEKPHQTAGRREYNSLDDGYIEAYCANPKAGKTAAILKAGYAGNNPRQEAYRLHKRLSERIKERYSELINELDSLAYENLKAMLEADPNEVGYSNMIAAIKAGMDYAGRKPGDTLTIKKEQSIDDIDAELKQIEQELAEQRLN